MCLTAKNGCFLSIASCPCPLTYFQKTFNVRCSGPPGPSCVCTNMSCEVGSSLQYASAHMCKHSLWPMLFVTVKLSQIKMCHNCLYLTSPSMPYHPSMLCLCSNLFLSFCPLLPIPTSCFYSPFYHHYTTLNSLSLITSHPPRCMYTYVCTSLPPSV